MAMVGAKAEQQGQNQVLEARERRQRARQAVARSMSGRSLIELSLDGARDASGPGDQQHRFLSALQRLETELGVAPSELVEDDAGFYGLFVTPLPALLARRRASRIESHEAWDHRLSIECYGLAGSLVATGKVPRETVGAPTLH
jgi:hypothetical protein